MEDPSPVELDLHANDADMAPLLKDARITAPSDELITRNDQSKSTPATKEVAPRKRVRRPRAKQHSPDRVAKSVEQLLNTQKRLAAEIGKTHVLAEEQLRSGYRYVVSSLYTSFSSTITSKWWGIARFQA